MPFGEVNPSDLNNRYDRALFELVFQKMSHILVNPTNLKVGFDDEGTECSVANGYASSALLLIKVIAEGLRDGAITINVEQTWKRYQYLNKLIGGITEYESR